MTRILFSDGVEFDTEGPYRVEERQDGLYVVGGGGLYPVDTRDEAEELITMLKPVEPPNAGR